MSYWSIYVRVIAWVWWKIYNFGKPFVIENMLQYSNHNFSCLFIDDNISIWLIDGNGWEPVRSVSSSTVNFVCVVVVKANPHCMHAGESSVFVCSWITCHKTSSKISTWFRTEWMRWEKVAKIRVGDLQIRCYDKKKTISNS